LELQPQNASSRFKVSARGLCPPNVGRIDKYGDPRGCGHQLTQESQPLCHHFSGEKIDPRRIAAWPGEAGDKTKFDRVFGDAERNRNGLGRSFGRECRSRAPGHRDHAHLTTDQIGGQLRHPIEVAFTPAIFERHVLALDVSGFRETPAKCEQAVPFKRVRP